MTVAAQPSSDVSGKRRAIPAGSDVALDWQISAAATELLNSNEGEDGNPVMYRMASLGSFCKVLPSDNGDPAMSSTSRPVLRGRLAEVASWFVKTKNEKTGEVDVKPHHPPMAVVDYLNDEPPSGFPVLDAVCHYPVLAPGDGAHGLALYQDPGYNAGIRRYLSLPSDYLLPDVGAADSAHLLMDLIGDFPYVSDADAANALAGMLTILLRPATALAPMFLLGKPQPRTGATLLANVIGRLITGRDMLYWQTGASDARGADDETRKAMSAAIFDPGFRGPMLMDNVADGAVFTSPFFAMELTAEHGGTRRLGFNDERGRIAFPPRTRTHFVTGNGLALTEDLIGRSCRVELNARSATPGHGRSYRIPNLPAYVLAHRGALLGHAVNIIRRWLEAGGPAASSIPVGGPGGFQDWVILMAAILEHAEVPAFLGNAQRHLESRAQVGLDRLVEAWGIDKDLCSKSCGVADLFPLASGGEGEPLVQMRGATEQVQKRTLGQMLKAEEGKFYLLPDGRQVSLQRAKVGNAWRYTLVEQPLV